MSCLSVQQGSSRGNYIRIDLKVLHQNIVSYPRFCRSHSIHGITTLGNGVNLRVPDLGDFLSQLPQSASVLGLERLHLNSSQ